MTILNTRSAGQWVALGGAAALLLAAAGASAATPEELCKGGQLAVLRLSTLKSPAARAGFEKATHDHMGWYRGHGYKTNRQLVGSVLLMDQATQQWSLSPTEMMTLHIDSPLVSRDKHDAAWDAYVGEYREASDIATEKMVCLQEPVK
jgi:hypothetical protein